MLSGAWGVDKTSAMTWLDAKFKEGPVADTEGTVEIDRCRFYPWKYQSQEDFWRGLVAGYQPPDPLNKFPLRNERCTKRNTITEGIASIRLALIIRGQFDLSSCWSWATPTVTV